MLISIDWIKDFVELPEISDKELSETFTLRTAEVEDVTSTNAHLKNIKVVEVIKDKTNPT